MEQGYSPSLVSLIITYSLLISIFQPNVALTSTSMWSCFRTLSSVTGLRCFGESRGGGRRILDVLVSGGRWGKHISDLSVSSTPVTSHCLSQTSHRTIRGINPPLRRKHLHTQGHRQLQTETKETETEHIFARTGERGLYTLQYWYRCAFFRPGGKHLTELITVFFFTL